VALPSFSFFPIHDAPANSRLRGFFIHPNLSRARGKESPWASLAVFQRLRTAPMSLTWKKASNQKAAEEIFSNDTNVTRLQFSHSGPVPALEKTKPNPKKGKQNTGISTPDGSVKSVKRCFNKKGNALNATFQVPEHSRNEDREESRLRAAETYAGRVGGGCCVFLLGTITQCIVWIRREPRVTAKELHLLV
jgi:hypothetical protein